MKPASSPMRAGNTASISSRTRRATTGEAPPVPTATTTSPRSTMAGKMKVECSRSSITLTGRPTALARADIAGPISPAPAHRIAITPFKSAISGSPVANSIRAASPHRDLTNRVAVGRKQTDARAGGGQQTQLRARDVARANQHHRPGCRSRNTGRNRIRPSSPEHPGLTGIIFYICVSDNPSKEKIISSLLQCNYRIFASQGQGREMQLLNKAEQAAMDRSGRDAVVQKSSRQASAAPLMDHLDTLEAQSIYIFREAFARLKRPAAVVPRKGLQRDGLARAQGVLRPRAVSRIACRYRQEISGDVCVSRSANWSISLPICQAFPDSPHNGAKQRRQRPSLLARL